MFIYLNSLFVNLQFVATDFTARTRSTHNEHCRMLESVDSDHMATTYGLTKDSILTNSKYFHVTEGLAPDRMHDLLEGTLQYEVKELLKSLITRRIICLGDLNQRIEVFPYDTCDSINKPSPITNLSATDHSLRQSGIIHYMHCVHKSGFIHLFYISFSNVVSKSIAALDHWIICS